MRHCSGEIERPIRGVYVFIFLDERQHSLSCFGCAGDKHKLDALARLERHPPAETENRVEHPTGRVRYLSLKSCRMLRGASTAQETSSIGLDLDGLPRSVCGWRQCHDLRRPHRLVLW